VNIDHAGVRRSAAVLAIAAVGGVVLASCGGDDDDAASDPNSLQVTASGGKADMSFEVDVAELPAGATEIELVNDSKVEIDGQLIYTADEHSDDEVIAEYGKAQQGEPFAEWFEAGGGPGATPPGESSTVTQELQTGNYYVVGSSGGPPTTPLARIELTDDGDAELPEADETVEAADYSFSGELTAGPNSLLLENNGEEWHHFLAARLLDGSTIEDARKFFETEEGPPPFELGANQSGEVQSTVLEGGASQIVNADLVAGTYAFYCFVSDKEGGPPHVVEGMVSEVEVTE
jgi:hypothetical protein